MDNATLRMRLAAASVVVATVGILGYISPEIPGYYALAGLLPAVLWTIVGISLGMSGWRVAWCSTWLVTASVWLACAWTWPPWSLPLAATWVTAAVTVVAISPMIPATSRPDGPGLLTRMLTGRALEWQQRIKRVSKIDVDVRSVTDWDSGQGYTVTGEFPPGGHTWEDLAAKGRNLASDLRLPDGCAVEVDQGEHQAAWRILVNTQDAFNGGPHPYGHPQYDPESDYLPMPTPEPGSIHSPAPIGVHAGGETAALTGLRQESVLIAGATGGGKSSGMSVLLCWHVTRTDQVTYVVDLTGGRLGAPFMQPYLDGQADRPAIDGLADTPERAAALLTWLRDVANTRPVTHRQAMVDADDDKIPVSRDLPAIRVVIDEPKTIWADPQLSRLAADIIRLQETTRAAAIRFDYTSLAGTLSALPGDLKRQISRRVATRAADRAEVAYILEWANARAIDVRALTKRPGMAYVGATEGAAPRLMRFWRVKPSSIRSVATAAAAVRPSLDAHAMSLPSYAAVADRWDWQKQPAKEPAMSAAGSTSSGGLGDSDAMRQFEQVEQEKQDLIERLRAQRAEYETADPFDALAKVAAPDPVRSAITTYLEGRGETPTGDIVAHLQQNGHNLTRQTIQDRLSTMAADDVITRPRHGHYTYP